MRGHRSSATGLELDDGDAVVAEGLAKAYHDLAERVFDAPTPLLTRAFRGRRPPGIEEEVQEDDDDDEFTDDDVEDDLEEEDLEGEPAPAVWALRDVSFHLSSGSAAALVGGSGSGKTTLLRVLGGALPPTAGRAVLAGRPSPLINLAVQLMAPTLTPEANVAVAAALVGLPRRRVRPRLDAVLELAGVSARDRRLGITRAPYRIAVASALELDARVLLLDDPFASASTSFRSAVLEAIERRRAEGATVLLETRDREALRQVCDVALWLEGGTLVSTGDVDEILAAHDASAASARSSGPSPAAAAGFNETAAIVSGHGDADGEGNVSIALRLEVARAAVTIQTGVGLERPDGLGLWFEQPDPVVCESPGFHRFQLVAHGVPPGRYAARIQARVLEGGAEAVIARGDMFAISVGPPSSGQSRAGETAWERREASWLYEQEQPTV
jgi:ABC-type polysaccharide/polyol phosphate transport system ATPase subunit